MFKLNVRLEEAILNIGRYEADLKARLAEIISRAAFEYVVTATSLIPIWSGASQSTFTELANAISLPLSISPVASAPNRISVGQGLSNGDLEVGSSKVSFTYSTDLPHLIHNEFNNANQNRDPSLRGSLRNPGPYNFTQIAASAAEAVTQSFVGPNINSHITKRVIRRRVI